MFTLNYSNEFIINIKIIASKIFCINKKKKIDVKMYFNFSTM